MSLIFVALLFYKNILTTKFSQIAVYHTHTHPPSPYTHTYTHTYTHIHVHTPTHINPPQVTFANTQYECACVHTMINHYKWLFQVRCRWMLTLHQSSYLCTQYWNL